MSKAERTRQFIIEQAAPVINKKGMAGTSITDIMEVTGLAKGGVYGNFENKDEICREAFLHLTGGLAKQMDRYVAKGKNPKEKLMRLFDFYLNGSFPEGGCPVLNFGAEADDTHPELRQMVGRQLDVQQKRIANLLRDGIDDSTFRDEVDPRAFALKAIAMLEGAILMGRVQGSSLPLRTVVHALKAEVEVFAS